MFNPYNILNIGMPVYLILFEICLRFVSNVDTSSFIGPTLAASGLGLLIGIVRPREPDNDEALEEKLKNRARPSVLRDSQDETLILLGWVSILIELLGWYLSCALTIKSSNKMFGYHALALYTGIGNYMITILLILKKK